MNISKLHQMKHFFHEIQIKNSKQEASFVFKTYEVGQKGHFYYLEKLHGKIFHQ